MAHDATVAATVVRMVAAAPVTEREIAAAIGYANPGALRAVMSGMAILPFAKIGPLSRACGADPGPLLRIALREYAPELAELVAEHADGPLTVDERALLDRLRDAGNGRALVIDDALLTRFEAFLADTVATTPGAE